MVFLEIVVVALAVLTAFLIFKILQMKIELEKKKERIREEAIEQSARIRAGKAIEKFVPFLENFQYDPQDVRWIGDPLDFVVFDGLAAGEPKQIIFTEVKSGDSQISERQKKLREIIEAKKVKWEEFRVKK
jgi:predicted Holliday junction resolvase-like endonuclease